MEVIMYRNIWVACLAFCLILVSFPAVAATDYCDVAKEVAKQAASVFSNDMEKGLKLFIKAWKLCNSPEMQYNLGVAYYRYGSLPEAEKSLRLAVKANNANPVWLNNLACVILDNRGNGNDALELAKKAVALDGNFIQAHDTLARAYLAAGRDLEALKGIIAAADKWKKDKNLLQSKQKIVNLYVKRCLENIQSGDIEKGLSGLKKGSFDSLIAGTYCRVLARLDQTDAALDAAGNAKKKFHGNDQIRKLYDDIMSEKIQDFYIAFKRGDDAMAVQQAKVFSETYPENQDAKKAYNTLFNAFIADAGDLQIPAARHASAQNTQVLTDSDAGLENLIAAIGDKSGIDSTDLDLKVDVEQKIPACKRKNRFGIAVLVGNQKYARQDRGLPDVRYAERDVAVMKKYLEKTMGYDPGNIIVRTNVTSGDFRNIFGSAENPTGMIHNYIRKDESDVFIYYVGHGGPGPQGKSAYLVPIDARVDFIQNNGYPLDLFYSIIEKLPAKKITVVLDSCFSGDSVSGALFKNVSPAMLKTATPIKKLAKAMVFCAADKEQVATWYPEKRHSLFSYFFLKGLQGAADKNKDKSINFEEMAAYLSSEVPYWARRKSNRIQTPLISGEKDTVLAVLE